MHARRPACRALHTYIHIYIPTYLPTCVCTYIHTYSTYIHACMHTYIHTHRGVYMDALYISIYIYAHAPTPVSEAVFCAYVYTTMAFRYLALGHICRPFWSQRCGAHSNFSTKGHDCLRHDCCISVLLELRCGFELLHGFTGVTMYLLTYQDLLFCRVPIHSILGFMIRTYKNSRVC